MPVTKGLATWAGIIAALGQYLAAVAVFLEADNQSDALGPLVTATATLLAVIVGRMQQAKALASRPAAPAPLSFTTSSGQAYSDVHFSAVRPIGGAASLDPVELGDADALPDYDTQTDPPPDEGDTSANGDVGEREA